MKKLHVAVVTETYPPEINGVARSLQRAVRFLAQRGHRIELVRPRQPADRAASLSQVWVRGSDAHAGADIGIEQWLTRGMPLPMYPDLRLGLAGSGRLAARWRAQRPDLVHVATEGPLGLAARQAARRLNIACTSDFRTNFHLYSRHYRFGMLVPLVLRYLRWFHNGTDATLVPTAALGDQLRTHGFAGLQVVGRGVDTQEFAPQHRSEALRRVWGAAPDELVVLHVGRLAPEKNIGLAVRACDAIRNAGRRARLVLVGDGPLRATLSRRAPAAVFAGWRRGADLSAAYASADLFLFPSMTETFGNVVLEALASGLPTLAYRHAAAGEHIVSELNGLTVTMGDEDAFVRAALRLAHDGRLRRDLGLAARQAALQSSWEQVLGQFEQVLLDAAAGRGLRHVAHLARAA